MRSINVFLTSNQLCDILDVEVAGECDDCRINSIIEDRRKQ